jgi:alpha-1,2-mannosyltransferase
MLDDEAKTYKEKRKSSEDDSDDGWENLEAYAEASADNGGMAPKEWDGIVGFFHPFW